MSFDFRDPFQTIRVKALSVLNGIPASYELSIQNNYLADTVPIVYQAVMDAFGKVVVGSELASHYAGLPVQTSLFTMTPLAASVTSGYGTATLGPALEELF